MNEYDITLTEKDVKDLHDSLDYAINRLMDYYRLSLKTDSKLVGDRDFTKSTNILCDFKLYLMSIAGPNVIFKDSDRKEVE